MNFEIRNGDVLEELEKLNAERRRFDALLADPTGRRDRCARTVQWLRRWRNSRSLARIQLHGD